MNWEEVNKKIRNEFFLRTYSSRMDEVWEEIYNYVREESDITGIENCNSFEDHITEDENGIGYYCTMGGDWEASAGFILFVNEEGEVWVKILKESIEKREDHLSEEEFIEEVESMGDSPVAAESECVGRLNFEKDK